MCDYLTTRHPAELLKEPHSPQVGPSPAPPSPVMLPETPAVCHRMGGWAVSVPTLIGTYPVSHSTH